MTQLTTPPNETYAVIVPKDSTRINIIDDRLWYRNGSVNGTQKLNGKFTILGTVTSELIDFDVSGIVKVKDDWRNEPEWKKAYEDSFRSLLKSKKVEIGENEKLVIIQKR